MYKTKQPIGQPKFKYKNHSHSLTKEKLCLAFDQNDDLNSIFSLQDPETSAEILLRELNIIIDSICPNKIVQCNNKYAPYFDNELINSTKDYR